MLNGDEESAYKQARRLSYLFGSSCMRWPWYSKFCQANFAHDMNCHGQQGSGKLAQNSRQTLHWIVRSAVFGKTSWVLQAHKSPMQLLHIPFV